MALCPGASVAQVTISDGLSVALCSFLALFSSYNLNFVMHRSKLYWNERFILQQKYVNTAAFPLEIMLIIDQIE